MKILIFAMLIASQLFANETLADEDRNRSLLIGIWEERSENEHTITLRRDNGTYQRKALKRHSYGKPPVRFQSTGRWWIENGIYHLTIETISEKMWRSHLGKEFRVKVLEVKVSRFRYISTDGANVSERKIGPSSSNIFSRVTLKALHPE